MLEMDDRGVDFTKVSTDDRGFDPAKGSTVENSGPKPGTPPAANGAASDGASATSDGGGAASDGAASASDVRGV